MTVHHDDIHDLARPPMPAVDEKPAPAISADWSARCRSHARSWAMSSRVGCCVPSRAL